MAGNCQICSDLLKNSSCLSMEHMCTLIVAKPKCCRKRMHLKIHVQCTDIPHLKVVTACLQNVGLFGCISPPLYTVQHYMLEKFSCCANFFPR